jgi:hypothetical protein
MDQEAFTAGIKLLNDSIVDINHGGWANCFFSVEGTPDEREEFLTKLLTSPVFNSSTVKLISLSPEELRANLTIFRAGREAELWRSDEGERARLALACLAGQFFGSDHRAVALKPSMTQVFLIRAADELDGATLGDFARQILAASLAEVRVLAIIAGEGWYLAPLVRDYPDLVFGMRGVLLRPRERWHLGN